MKIGWALVVGVVLVLCGPSAAMAWGPATHVGLGQSVLDQAGLLPAGVAWILLRHWGAYLYGCVAADVVFAKRLSRIKQFCHHWSTAFGLVDSARTDSAKSFAYGYLSHLAADTVAHGKFVPRQILVSGCSINFGHFYWEMRADAALSQACRRKLGCLMEMDHTEHLADLRSHLRGTFLTFEWNRALFDRMNALAVHEGFGQTINLWGRVSGRPLAKDMLEGYHSESVDRILAILSEGRESSLLREDPNGSSALMQARVQRKKLRSLQRHGMSVERRVREVSLCLSPAMARLTMDERPGRTPPPIVAEPCGVA